MPRRIEVLATGEIYHIYNRGTEKRPIFLSNKEKNRFIELVRFYQRLHHYRFSKLTVDQRREVIEKRQGDPLVEILCWCLMPNHFHLLLKQLSDGGISNFMRILSDGYSRYFNLVHQRIGPLFQGKFKSVRIEDDAQLLHITRYIHLNPVTGYLAKKAKDYHWSSYHEYTGGITEICQKDLILKQFQTQASYQQFVEDFADYEKKLDTIKHLTHESL